MDEYSRSAFRNIYEPFFANTIDLVNPIDLPKIIEKVNLYTSFEEFLADVQWFVHNCEIKFTGELVFFFFVDISAIQFLKRVI